MSTVNSEIRFAVQAPSYITSNPSKVLASGEPIFFNNGTYVFGDGTTALNALTVYGSSGSSGAWGSITGTLSNQNDLQNALNAKLDSNQKSTSANQIAVTNGSNIITSVSVGANQSIRRNSGDTAFEAYTPTDDAGIQDAVPSGRWFHQLMYGARSYAQTGVDQIYYWPIYIEKQITIDALGFIFANVGTNVRLGIYNSNSNNQPSSLVYDSGNINVSSGLAFYTHSITGNQVLNKGVYFLAFQNASNATGLVWKGLCVVTDTQNININTDRGSVLTEYTVYGAFPANAGTLYALASNNAPLIYLRKI